MIPFRSRSRVSLNCNDGKPMETAVMITVIDSANRSTYDRREASCLTTLTLYPEDLLAL